MTEKIYSTYIENFESKDDFRRRSYSNKVSFFIVFIVYLVYIYAYLIIILEKTVGSVVISTQIF